MDWFDSLDSDTFDPYVPGQQSSFYPFFIVYLTWANPGGREINHFYLEAITVPS